MAGSVSSLGFATWPPSPLMQVEHHSLPITVTSATPLKSLLEVYRIARACNHTADDVADNAAANNKK